MTVPSAVVEPFAPHVVVLSSIGARNVGDEAMLLGVVSGLRRRIPGARISVVSAAPLNSSLHQALGKPENLPSAYPAFRFRSAWQKVARRVPVLGRSITNEVTALLLQQTCRRRLTGTWPWFAIASDFEDTINACQDADVVVDIGGANINGLWSSSFLDKSTLVGLVPESTPIFLTGQGVEALPRRVDRRRLRKLADRATLLSVREQASLDIARTCGVKAEQVTLTGDDAFNLRPSVQLDDAAPYIAVQFRKYLEYSDVEALDAFAQALDAATERTGLRLVGIPMHFGHRDERLDLEGIRRRMRNPHAFDICQTELGPQEALDRIAGASVTIGMSHHFAVFSVISGVPSISLVHGAHYEHKMTGLTAQFPATLTAYGLLGVPAQHVAEACEVKLQTSPETKTSMAVERASVQKLVEQSLDQVAAAALRQIVS